MGRHKKLTFSCSYCGKGFKRKINLNKHLLCHPDFTSKTRVARVRSNWCHVCRKSFAESEYKLHIETEHKFDNYKICTDNTDDENGCKPKDSAVNLEYSSEDSLTNEGKYSVSTTTKSRGVDKISPAKLYKKRGRKPGKTFQNASSSTHLKIKTEPPDTYKTNVAPNSPYVTCKLCDFKCKTLRGLNVHISFIHRKKSEKKSFVEDILQTLKTDSFIKEEPQDKDSDQVKNPMKSSIDSQPLIATNFLPNTNQNAQTGIIYNIIPNQSFSNFPSIAYQPNIQTSFKIENEAEQVETIPPFDCDSEQYIKALKKFIGRCRRHEYPLTPMMCKTLNHINREIANVLANPENAMKKKTNHFYFMQIKSRLSEIMVGHMRYVMGGER